MRKTLLTTLLLLACSLLWAGNVSQREAMQLASRLFGADTPMQLVAAAEGEHPAYYVFNAQRSGFRNRRDRTVYFYRFKGTDGLYQMETAIL